MKKKLISIFTAIAIASVSLMSNFTVSAYDGTFDYLKEQYLEPTAKNEVDWTLFDDYLKYSLDIDDYDSLTDEKKELCQFIFETERSRMPYVYCLNARNSLLKDESPKRVSFDDPQTIASVVDPAPSYYTFFSEKDMIVPDIVYNYYYSYAEYWLDDEGTERIILNGGNSSEFEYVKFYDEMPSDPEIAENVLSSDDGKTFIYCETRYTSDYKNDYSLERFSSDIWEYVIVPDGTAVIVGCILPTFGEAVPIEEPTVLPEKLDGITVSGIFGGINGTGITKLIVPENIRYINSITNMNYLTNVQINAPDLELGNGSFISCHELKSAELNVKKIVGTAFMDCPGLESVEIESAQSIHSDAFSDLPALNRVTLPDNLETIGQCAFTGTAVKELELPQGLRVAGTLKMPYFGFNSIVDTLTDSTVLIADSDCVIKGYYDTEAHKYAVSRNMKFIALDENIAYGDINLDGEISVADAVVLQKYITGSDEAIGFEADLSKDGVIDIFDVIAMRSKLVSNN